MMSETVALAANPLRRAMAALSLVLLAACGGSSERAPALPDDLSRDLNLASGAGVAPVSAAFGDTAATSPAPTPEPAPAPPPAPRPAPAPAPVRTPAPTPVAPRPDAPATAPAEPEAPAPAPAPAPVSRTLLAAGTTLTGATATRVCTTTNRPGDRLVMRLTDDVTGPDGTRIAAGTAVLLEVAAADSLVTLRVRAIQHDGDLVPLVATAAVDGDMEGARVANGSDKKKVIGGAIAGAIIGQVLGRDTRGTIIGAAGGAAAGAIAARRSGTTERCLPAGATVRVVLDQPLVVTTPATSGANS